MGDPGSTPRGSIGLRGIFPIGEKNGSSINCSTSLGVLLT